MYERTDFFNFFPLETYGRDVVFFKMIFTLTVSVVARVSFCCSSVSVDPDLCETGPQKQQSTALSAPWSMQARFVYHCTSYQPFVNCHVNLSVVSTRGKNVTSQACRQLSAGGGDQYPFFNYLTKNRNVWQTWHGQSVRKGCSVLWKLMKYQLMRKSGQEFFLIFIFHID